MRYFYKNKNSDFYVSKVYETPSFWLLISLIVVIVSILLELKSFPYDLTKIILIALMVFIGLSAWYVWLFKRYLGSIKHVLSYWVNIGLIGQLQTSLLNAKNTGAVTSKSYSILPRIWVYRDDNKLYYRIQRIPGSFERDLDDLGEIIGSTLGDRYEVMSKQLDNSRAWYLYTFSFVSQHLRWVPKSINDLLMPPYTIKLMNGVEIDISKLPHLACFGLTGSRKTSTLLAIIAQILPTCEGIYFLDPKSEFSVLSSFVPSTHFASNESEVQHVFDELIQIAKKRSILLAEEVEKRGVMGLTAKDIGLKPIYLVVDEYASMKASFRKPKELDTLMLQALMTFRSFGIFILYASQSPSTQVLSNQMREQFGTYILLGTANDDTQRMAFGQVATTGTVPIGSGYYLEKVANMPTPQRFEVPDLYRYHLNNLETLKQLYEMGNREYDIRKQILKER